VTNYRFYFLNGDDNERAPENHDCDDDLKALDKAYELSREFDVEVWCGTRRICRIKQDSTNAPLPGHTPK
jgi:hypothetical protein